MERGGGFRREAYCPGGLGLHGLEPRKQSLREPDKRDRDAGLERTFAKNPQKTRSMPQRSCELLVVFSSVI
jgi:hypothetical protein